MPSGRRTTRLPLAAVELLRSYTVTIEDSINGTVKADRTRTSAGTIVTLTVTPDTGYTLETLTVTPSSGKEVELTDKGNGQYTFKMPSSKVNVKATFIDDNTMLNFFVDVPADVYFYDAVLRAVKEGITNGTSATTFSPNNPCTRAQMATFLWCAATSPEPVGESNPFTDVRQMPTTQRQYSGPMSRVLPAAPVLLPLVLTIPAPAPRWSPSCIAIS